MAPFDCIGSGARPRSAPGARQQPAVVLLHSSGGSARQWTALAERLQPRFHVHAVDLHGHGTQAGWSESRRLALADEVALVEPILQAAGCVHLVGHSYGGAVALKLAELHPEAVLSLVAYEPVLMGWLFNHVAAEIVDLSAMARDFGQRIAAGDESGAAARFLGYWSGPEAWTRLPAERQQAVAARIAAVAPHFHALFTAEISPRRLRRVNAPMLFLSGGDTAASARRMAALLRRELPDAVHETLAGLGHMGPVTHAAAVNLRIEAFLRSVAASHAREEPAAA
jgi:pimeloyl-ACP methyl ester carboxylesterase